MTKARTTKRDRVEQAVAFGHSPDWICDRLGVDPAYVDETLRRMDKAATESDDEPKPKPPAKVKAPKPKPERPRGKRAPQVLLPLDLDRPLSSYYGPADPTTLAALLDALFPMDLFKRNVA